MKTLSNQNGVALITSILILALLTGIGIMAMQTSITEVRISTNHLIHNMNFYAAESGIAMGPIDAKDTQLDDTWDGTWPIEGYGDLSNKCSYDYTVSKLADTENLLPDIKVVSKGTHPRGGLVSIEARFTYAPAFIVPDVPLWVGGDLVSKTQSNVDNGGYVEDGISYDIMVVQDHAGYSGSGKIAPNAKEVWINERMLALAHDNFDPLTRTYGSPEDMRLVIADPDEDGNVAIGNQTGYGLLYVKGNLTINGDFNWHGLIYVEGNLNTYNGAGFNDCTDRADSVWGSMIVKGNANMQNGDICYDRGNLNILFETLSRYRMTSWRQL
jgi:hypothetical protein